MKKIKTGYQIAWLGSNAIVVPGEMSEEEIFSPAGSYFHEAADITFTRYEFSGVALENSIDKGKLYEFLLPWFYNPVGTHGVVEASDMERLYEIAPWERYDLVNFFGNMNNAEKYISSLPRRD